MTAQHSRRMLVNDPGQLAQVLRTDEHRWRHGRARQGRRPCPSTAAGRRNTTHWRLARRRTPASTCSVTGTVFLDIIFTGLPPPPEGGAEIMGRRHGLEPRRRGQPRRGASRLGLPPASWPPSAPTCTATSAGRRSRRTKASTSRASRRLRGLALPGDGVPGLRRRPRHGHPRPPAADRRPTSSFGHVPEAAVCFADVGTTPGPVGRRRGRAAAAWSSPTSGWDDTGAWDAAGAARAARGLPRLRAQRRRGDGLHPQRPPRTPRSRCCPTGCRSPS